MEEPMPRRLKSQVSALIVTGCLASGLVLACSGSNKPGSGFGSSSGGSSGGSGGDDTSSGGSGGSGGGSGGILGPGGGSGGPGNADAACAASSSKGQQAPLDIYMMLDQSGSMNESAGT